MMERYCQNCGIDTKQYISEDVSAEGFFEECWICEECESEEFDVYCD